MVLILIINLKWKKIECWKLEKEAINWEGKLSDFSNKVKILIRTGLKVKLLFIITKYICNTVEIF